jgi:hypothetical protein
MHSEPRPPEPSFCPAAMTNSMVRVFFSVRSAVGPHAKSMCRRRSLISVSLSGNTKPGRLIHHTLSPLASTSFICKSLTAPLPLKRSRRSKCCGQSTGSSRLITA